MNLKEFVSESFKQIFEGITEAQNHLKENSLSGFIVTSDRSGDYVNFDVAITIDESSQTDIHGGAGLKVAGIGGIGGGGKNQESNSEKTFSRIPFKVFVKYPAQKVYAKGKLGTAL